MATVQELETALLQAAQQNDMQSLQNLAQAIPAEQRPLISSGVYDAALRSIALYTHTDSELSAITARAFMASFGAFVSAESIIDSMVTFAYARNFNALDAATDYLTAGQLAHIKSDGLDNTLRWIAFATYDSLDDSSANGIVRDFMSKLGAYVSAASVADAMQTFAHNRDFATLDAVMDNLTPGHLSQISSDALDNTLRELATITYDPSGDAVSAAATRDFMARLGEFVSARSIIDGMITFAYDRNYAALDAVTDYFTPVQLSHIRSDGLDNALAWLSLATYDFVDDTVVNGATRDFMEKLGHYISPWQVENSILTYLNDVNPHQGKPVFNHGALSAVLENLSDGQLSGFSPWLREVLAAREVIIGQNADDHLSGNAADNYIYGLAGADWISGQGGGDIIYGGRGDDVIYGDRNLPAVLVNGEYVNVLDKAFTDTVTFPNVLEAINIHDIIPPGSPAIGIREGNLEIDRAASITLTVQNGMMTYDSSLGIFGIGADGAIDNASILWGNIKTAGVGIAHQIGLPVGEDGGRFGFFIIADGNNENDGYGGMDISQAGNIRFIYDYGLATERAATIHDPGTRVNAVYDDGETERALNGYSYFTTGRGESADINWDGKAHVISGVLEDNNADTLRIGFEDLPMLGDADFQDALFDININPVYLTGGDDIIFGGSGNDFLYGNLENDVLYGGAGVDFLHGGTGADTFMITDTANVDKIMDFNLSQGDRIDLSEILEGFNPLSDAIADFVNVRNAADGAILSVDANGLDGGASYADVAMILNVSDISITDMFNSGNIIVA